LRSFLLDFDFAADVDDDDLDCWVRRFDKDNDKGLSFSELVTSLEIMTNYKR
jgi:hypothetical protein